MQSNRKRLCAVSVAALVVMAGILYWRGYRHAYPYGPKPAALPIVVNALRAYASDHHQSFPNTNGDSYQSLELLYPNYLSGAYLAGLSKDPGATELALRNGGHLTPENCSLVYVPGLFATDDQRIAIVWETRTGISFNGRSHPGRAVGLLNGEVAQVPDGEWRQFQSSQAILRQSALRSRTNSQSSGRD